MCSAPCCTKTPAASRPGECGPTDRQPEDGGGGSREPEGPPQKPGHPPVRGRHPCTLPRACRGEREAHRGCEPQASPPQPSPHLASFLKAEAGVGRLQNHLKIKFDKTHFLKWKICGRREWWLRGRLWGWWLVPLRSVFAATRSPRACLPALQRGVACLPHKAVETLLEFMRTKDFTSFLAKAKLNNVISYCKISFVPTHWINKKLDIRQHSVGKDVVKLSRT